MHACILRLQNMCPAGFHIVADFARALTRSMSLLNSAAFANQNCISHDIAGHSSADISVIREVTGYSCISGADGTVGNNLHIALMPAGFYCSERGRKIRDVEKKWGGAASASILLTVELA
jgi:hypothetical protein